jgi:beta-N-acetylhexosaminidase
MSSKRSASRRRAVLAMLAVLAAVGGAAVGAGSHHHAASHHGSRPSSPTASPLAGRAGKPPPAAVGRARRLTLAQQVGQVLVMAFSGTSAPAYVLRAMRQSRAGGVILFGSNVGTPASLRALTGALQRAAGGSALICTDQEGGTIRIVRFSAPVAAPSALGTESTAGAVARQTAGGLRSFGVNVNLAPVADVAAVDGSVMRRRAFPGDPADVARLVRATIVAYAQSGVATTAKHFPGLGSATQNTDSAPRVVVDGSLESLRARELVPFRAAIAAGTPLIMSSHAIYPALSPLIASQSPRILQTLLRGELGFRGAVITDSLEAASVRAHSSVAEAAVRSIAAGNDIALTTGPGSYRKVRLRMLAEARRSPSFRRRVAAAAARVLALKAQMGLAPVRPRP